MVYVSPACRSMPTVLATVPWPEPPFADERRAASLDLLGRSRLDHVVVVGRYFLVQPLGRMRQEVAVLMDRAPLHWQAVPHDGNRALQARSTINDEELGPLQSAPDEIVENCPPSLRALAAHRLDRKQYLLAVGAHSVDDESDGSCSPACRESRPMLGYLSYRCASVLLTLLGQVTQRIKWPRRM